MYSIEHVQSLGEHPISYILHTKLIVKYSTNLIFHLHARLRTGWSTGKITTTSLDPAERDAIIGVIQRNELIETAERERVGKIVERVEKIKQRATDFGPRYCR